MKVLINITEDTYNSVCNESMLPPNVRNVTDGIKNGQPLSTDLTNGDMIKAIFPNATFMIDEEKDEQGTKNLYVYTDDFEGFAVDLDWWNTPYKGVK